MYISYIAILKAGLAFCPIAHDTPKERLQALFEDLQPITVLVAGSAPSAASAMSAKPLLDTTPYLRACDVSTSCSLEKGTPTIPSTSTAYVLYTSGTTGRAKGVAISHASAACTISALSSHYGFGQLLGPTNTQQLRWFQGAAPTFDISIFEIFWTLSTGSTLCCAPRDFTLQNLDKVLTTLKADITNITPSFASLLDPSSIKGLMLGGESLTTRIIQDFAPYNAAAISRSVGKPSGLYNGYGPTEAAIYCIAQAHVPSGQRGSVIGTPLSTCGVLIVDEGYTEAASTLTLRPVPMGATGELVLIGPQISQTGYINRESETAAAFFDDDTWGRGYKSGDRARIVWDDRGNPIIEFLGRISDDQVKLSGRRVELAEIESILTEKVPQIRETLSVVWRPQGSVSGSEKVVSLIVLDPDSRDDFGSVERDCMRVAHQYLPDYMRPFRLLNVEELPKSSSGKKNRAKAAEYVQVHLEQHNYPTSRDVDIGRRSPLSNESDAKLEDELLEMVSNILGTNQTINATTLLASTGLDSLLAMRFLRDIRHRWSRSDLGQEDPRYSQLQPSLAQLLGADASIRSVFFSAFAEGKREQARLRVAEFSRKNMPEALSKLNVTPRDVEAILPATNTQSQLAVSFAMDARNYISHSILRLRAGTCVPALMHSIESVISLQPIYRSMMIPCDDSFSPFAQVVVTQDAWSQITEASPRITHQKVCAQYLDSGIDDLVENAAAKMNLESNILYQIQVIEEDQDIASPVVLILSFAHCICDGASIQLLLLDIASCFSGQTLPQRNSIFDSVVDWASGLDPATDRMWQDELVGQEAESLGSLSGNNAEFGQSKEKKDFGMVQHQSELSWAYLESRSRILNSSPLSIVQAAWCVLISLLSEADTLDVTFGSVLSGHHTPTHAPDFSVVPCRVALPSSQTVQELLEALNAKSRVAQTKRHTSFGVLRALPYNTALALQAYTDSDEKREPEVASFPWTEARSRAIRYDFAIFAEVIPPSGGLPGSPEYFGDGMTFKITYHEDTLSKVSAGFVARQLAGLVDVFLGADPYDLVQALPSRLPRHLLSVEGNATDQSHSAESHATLLHSQFESQAAATPDRVALTFYTSLDTPPTDVSYRELDSRANGLANILRQENAEVIPICIQRSVDLYVAILAILKAGSAWCPIDDTSPIQRRTSLIARTQSNVLLTNKESLHLVEPCLSQESLHGWRVIIMDEYANHELLVRPNPRTGTLSPGSICGTDLAYLLWTSGTTGEPKGVMIPHSAAFQAMKDLQIQVAHDDKAGQVRTLQLSSYTFDVFVQDLFYTWGLAGCVVSGTRELILGTFVDFIWKARPTHAHLTPSFGASIAVEEIRGSTLHYVTFIGEKLTEDVAHAWAAPDITTAAYNTYGPAENAVVSTMRQFRGKTREPAKAANVGFPLNSCTAFVVREVEMAHGQQKRWELVPRYGVGELALGGLQVGKGYLANKTKTTKSFITNANAIDGLIYLTGDMVRLNDHGFEFLGRNDDLVKITGIRIELSEISAACATVKSEEAAIEHVETLYLPLPGSDAESKSKVVVTFVSIKTSDIDTDSIRSQVIQRAKDLLPAYMVPGHVIILDGSMPRTASNKVDRKVLREIYQSSDLKLSARGVLADPSGGVDASKTEHWSEEELPIVDMITAYLEIPPERNSPDNTLAALGLSSLQITKLAWYLKRELECPINVLSLMRCQILGELINVVTDAVRPRCEATPETMIAESDNTRADHSWLANIREDLTNKLEGSMRPQDTLCVLPATPMQESLLVETMLDGGAYWTHRVFDLSHMEQIDAQRLEAAWEKCTQRFDILRSVFFPLTLFDIEGSDSSISWARAHGISSTILQFVRSNAKVYWTTCSQGDLGDHARKLQTELQPSKTDRPPWAVTYTESEHKLMLSMHHALYDGVSSQILLETVTALYRDSNHLSPDCTLQFERGLELGLLPTTEQREEAASLWAAQLMELQKAVGPTNGPFPDLTQSRQKQSREILCARAAVPAIFKSRDAAYPSVPIAFQSAFGCILAWYMELDAVILGQTVSQRIIHPDLESVMGPAIATIPVVIRASSSSASELWENMSRDSAKYSHVLRNLHPVDLKRAFKKANNGTNLPLPGIFVYHPAPHSDIEQPTSLALQMFKEQDMALSLNVEHPLALNIFEAEKTIELTGDGRQISQGQLDLMLQQTLEFMNAMVGSPDTALCQLRNRFARNLVSVSGKTLSASPQQVDPTDTVAIHASNSPDWIAAEELVFEESDALDDTILTRQITYGQLNTLTNAIATKLTTHAAQLHTDDVVAMYMARDIMSLAVTLAIFRAGFVYLPIDEDLPLARKQLIIRDAKAKLVITTADLENTLGLDRNDDPPVFLVPDGNDAIDTVSSWPRSWTREPIINGGYLLYTSGSSGRPKGVRVSAQNLCSFIEAFSTRLVEHAPATATLGNSGKYLNLTSRAFDPHLTQMFVPWYLGYRVVIGKDRNSMLASLHQVIKHSEITHFGSVPSVLTKMGLKHSDVPTVRVITTGGEQASSELLDMWSSPAGPTAADDHGRATLFNFYGPTEVTIGCLGHAVNHNSNSRNLGLPLHGLEALLICHTSEGDAVLAMRGQPGELCIAGPQVAIGYLDRPDETAKSFCTIHLPNWGEKRVYRTGDMMRMMHDGTLEFLGRIDQQTKVRGQRLELGEVVTFLKESSVGEGHLDFAAAVVSNPNANNQQVLMGFVARDARDLLRRELEADSQVVHNLPQAQQDLFNVIGQKCDEKLPAFMVPTTCFVQREGRGEICQVVLAAATFSPFDNLGTMVDVVRQMNHRPPFRVQLDEHKEPGQVFVTLTIHHGLFDGAALGTLKQKLEAEYANSSSDVASSSASLELMKQVTFECQLSDMQTDSVRLQWQTLLQDVQPCYVTDSFGTMIESSTARSTLRFRHTATQLKEKFKAATSNTTSKIQLSSAFQLATALCLARLTQKADVVYGYVLSLRPLLSHTIPRVDDFIGPCLNTLTQAIHLQSKDETLTELTQRIHQYHCDASQGSMPFVPSEMVQRWVGSDRKLFDSLLSINIIDNDVAVTPENKPGGMTALHTESKSDMALAIDVDIYTDGSIDLTLSSCGVLSSSRLADTAQIFEKIVCSAATAGATVGQFVPVYHHTSNLARISDPKAEGSKSTLSDRGQLSATDSVHIALSRFLQLPKPEISTKPGTTTLYQLGLDSITVLPFVKCLSGETGLKLTVDAVIKSRTVQGLIDHVHGSEAKLGKRLTSTELEAVESVHKPSQKEDTVSDSYDNILAELAKDLFFLATPMQEGMLSASFAITKSAYLYSHSIQLSGKALEMDTPSLDAFSAAVQDVIQACEILRTQFTFTQNSQAPWLARDGPVFDEYPLIANYFISGNTLCGKLRGNLGSSELEALGRAVEAMLMRIAVGDAHEPVIDLAKMKITTRHDSKKNGARSSKTDRVSELNGHTPHCDAVLDIVKAILGPRSKGRALDYYTKLANAGIDSILAIKLANAVRKKTGLIVSVFQIMKGASVRDIVENGTRDQRVEPHASTQKSQSQAKEQEMKSLVAEKLQSSEDLILSVLPVLSGQRAHLEQWLLHGKRFFEAPWLYRVLDDNIDKEMVARRWSELVRAHDILRTTFAVVGKDADLVQVTLSEADNGSSRFTVIHDDGKLIEELVTQHISKENADPSNMRKPPSRLSFLEGSDGKAVVLRFHHALYDAWSIKMIESDLINMLTHGTALQHHGSLELQVQQIRGARDLAMENSYWRQHLLRAQDTILLPAEDSQLAVQVSHGPHFKVKSSVGIPREAVDCLASTKNPSAVILFAFAKTLSRFTGRSHPTFGLSHASRVLCSTTGAQDIDLTAANMPTLTVTPMSVDLERGANAPASALTSIQHHLAQLAKFSQTGNVRKMGPRFNTHINIMFVDSDQAVQLEERPNKTKALSRWRLGEPIASDYFTISKPSTLSASLVDQLDISHLYPQQLFFNITVQDQQSISVSLSGDRSLLAGSMMSAEAFIACFTTQLEESIQQASE
ncbi:hypothetical protein V2A60_002796 [Cordyceps javanica]